MFARLNMWCSICALVLLLGCRSSGATGADASAPEASSKDITAMETVEAEIATQNETTNEDADTADVCIPVCPGKECGDNGCGGSCGECEGSKVQCVEGECQVVCDCVDDEDCLSVDDSDLCNGRLVCGLTTPCMCELDPDSVVECPDGQVCIPKTGECCSPSCEGKECGSDGCGGFCGFCPPLCQCEDWSGQCIGCICVPDCEDKECGYDGCDGFCGECGAAQVCTLEGACCGEDCCEGMLDWPLAMQKVASLMMGNGGHPGQSLDVDGDANTCSPQGNCSNGVDNALSGLQGQACIGEGCPDPDFDFAAWVEESYLQLSMLMAFPDADQFIAYDVVRFYSAQPYDAGVQCPPGPSNCHALCPDTLSSPACQPMNTLGNIVLAGSVLSAGDDDSALTVHVPWSGQAGQWQTVELSRVRVSAKVSLSEGKVVAVTEGVIAGAVHKQAVLDWLAPMGPGELLVADIDLDGDGVPESLSFGFRFVTEATNAVEVLDEPCMVELNE